MTPQLDQAVQTHLPVRADLPAGQARAFLDELAQGRHRVETALVFADWLDDHGDARGQAVRWSAWKDSHGRESRVRKTLAGKLHAWMTHYRDHLVGTDQPGGTLEWHGGLLRLRADAGVLTRTGRAAFVPRVWDLVDAGWLGEVVFRGLGSERLLAGVVRWLTDVPRVGLTAPTPAAIELLEELPSLRGLSLSQLGQIRPAVLQSLRAHPHLEELTIHACDLDRLSLFDLPRLRDLRLGHLYRVEHLQLRNLPSLETLHLGGMAALLDLDLAELPTLREGTVAGATGLSSIAYHDLPALERVTVCNAQGGTLALRRLPTLATLALRGARFAQVELEDLDVLASLDFGKSPLLSSLAVTRLPALARLVVRNAGWLGQFSLVGVPALRSLDLSGSRRLPEAWFAALARCWPQCVVRRDGAIGS